MKEFGFSFINMKPDTALQARANLRLIQILASGPRDATALGTIERVGDYYIAKVSVSSRYYSRTEKTVGLTLERAVERLLDRIEESLDDWRYSRERRRLTTSTPDALFSEKQGSGPNVLSINSDESIKEA